MSHRHMVGWIIATALLLPPALRAGEPVKPRLDASGDPLPDGAVARIGTTRLRHAGPARRVAFAPDGKSLASGGDDGSVRLWETATGKLLRRFEVPKGDVDGLAFSPDGKSLLCSVTAGSTCLYDVATGKKRLTLRGECAAFAPDGKTIATRSRGDAGTVQVYDATAGRELRRFNKEVDCPSSNLAFTPDGKTLAFVTVGGKAVSLFDPDSGEDRHAFRSVKSEYVCSLDLSGDGKRLAAGSYDGSVSLWDVAGENRLHRITGEDVGATTVRFSQDGKVVAGGDQDGRVRLWDVATGKELRRWVGHTAPVSALAFSPDGKVLASASEDQTVRLWDAATGKELPQSVGSGPISCAALSRDGKLLVTGYEGAGLRFWEPATGKPLARAGLDFAGPVTAVALSPDAKLIAAGNEAGTVALWEVATGKQRFTVVGKKKWRELPAGVNLLTFLPDGQSLAVGHTRTGSSPRVFDAATGKSLRALLPAAPADPSRIPPRAVAFAPGGSRWALAGLHDGVSLRDAATGKEVKLLVQAMADESTALAMAPDGRALATAVSPHSVSLWETATGRLRRSWRAAGPERIAAVVAISADGRLVAAADNQRIIHVWHAGTGRELRTFAGHDGPVRMLSFAAGGKLLSVSDDGTGLVWDTAGLKADQADWKTKITAKAWEELGDDNADSVYPLIALLAESPEVAPGLLRKHLKPVTADEVKRIDRLIAQLDDDDFDRREQASRELEQLGARAQPALRKVARAKQSAEVARRVADLLKKIEEVTVSGDRLREMRALEALEGLGTPEAKKLLEELAKGDAEAALTQEAKASLERMGK